MSDSTTRLPFRVTLYDADLVEHTLTVYMDVQQVNGDGWDGLLAMEREAAEILAADLQVSLDVDALLSVK